MFDIITDAIENVLDVIDGITSGELPTKRQVAQLVADGVSIYDISEASGFAVETIQELLEDS